MAESMDKIQVIAQDIRRRVYLQIWIESQKYEIIRISNLPLSQETRDKFTLRCLISGYLAPSLICNEQRKNSDSI